MAITSTPREEELPPFFSPINLTEGIYSGTGTYITASNIRGSYTTTTLISQNVWGINYERDGENQTFIISFEPTKSNHFKIKLSEHEGTNETKYEGQGYCLSYQCHLSIDMSNRLFEETLFFDTEQNTIYRVGSISSPTSKELIMSWEEVMELQNADKNDEDYIPLPDRT